MNKSKKTLIAVLITILSVMLIAVAVLMVISIKRQNDDKKALIEQVKTISEQKNKAENELKTVKEEVKTREDTVLHSIEKLAKDELQGYSIQVGAETYKAKEVDIVRILLYTPDYLDLRAKKDEQEGKPEELVLVHNDMKSGLYDYAGEITFVLKYDEDVTGGIWAGSGANVAEGNYALGGALFTIKDGKIEFATGW